MAKTVPETIFLSGEPNRFEAEAGGAITPGHLIEINSSGNVVVHNTAGGVCPAWVAMENDIGGDDIDHAYASGEIVLYNACRAGDEALLTVANGENIAIGDRLQSNGNGEVQEAADETGSMIAGSMVAIALQAKDMSGSSAVDPSNARIRARII